ncbi:hypothetical protein ABIB00_007423 [Bradyrhizobium sp. LB14.3]
MASASGQLVRRYNASGGRLGFSRPGWRRSSIGPIRTSWPKCALSWASKSHRRSIPSFCVWMRSPESRRWTAVSGCCRSLRTSRPEGAITPRGTAPHHCSPPWKLRSDGLPASVRTIACRRVPQVLGRDRGRRAARTRRSSIFHKAVRMKFGYLPPAWSAAHNARSRSKRRPGDRGSKIDDRPADHVSISLAAARLRTENVSACQRSRSPHARPAGRQRDHRGRPLDSAATAAVSVGASTEPVIRIRTPAANSFSIAPQRTEGALTVRGPANWTLPQNGLPHPAAAPAQARKRGRRCAYRSLTVIILR